MKIAIQGVGAVGGFGCGVAALQAALSSGAETVSFGPAPFQADRAGWPVYRSDTTPLGRLIPPRKLRRMDHFTKMGLLGARLALEDAGMTLENRDRLGIVVATGYGAARTTFGYQDSILDAGDIGASPTLFSHSVHNAAAANISILLGIRGPSLTVSQFEVSVASALLTARAWLAERRVDAVLFGGIDEYCDVLGYCLGRCIEKDGFPPKIQPFQFGLQSAIAGEGAAFFLLTGEGREGNRYGRIREIRVGRPSASPCLKPEREVVVLGADGDPACGAGYIEMLPPSVDAAAYAPLYGSFPSNQAFDLAAAAVMRNEETIYPVPGDGVEDSGIHAVETPTPLMDRDIRLIKCSRNGWVGDITCSM